jgi:hypothetical protein
MVLMALGRGKRILVVIVLLIVGGAVAWRTLRLSDLAQIGAGYAAEQTCACVFVAGRTLDSCVHELDPMAQRLVLVRAGTDEVTARAFGVAHATARYQPGFGCSLQN